MADDETAAMAVLEGGKSKADIKGSATQSGIQVSAGTEVFRVQHPPTMAPWSLKILLAFHINAVVVLSQCPPLGSVLPAPRHLSANANLSEIAAGIADQLQNTTSAFNATALSVGVKSIYESSTFLDFHNTPSVFNTSGTHKVDGNTVYRIASTSKLFTALAVLQLAGTINLSDPITKYVPNLVHLSKEQSKVNSVTTVDWPSVTVEALASHLGGIGADHFLANFGKRFPVYSPLTTPVYSNAAYGILGRAIENVSGKTYSDYLQGAVFRPLNLTRTSVGAPQNNSLGFIPAETNWWGTSLGFEQSSGGIYSSNNDLLAFGSAILSSKLLTPLQTRTWMKPRTFTSSLGISVGAPWEIARGANLTSDGHIIDFYTKAGNLWDYNALLVLVPDYGLVMALNMAGPDGSIPALQEIFSRVMKALIPAVDAVTRSDAIQTYAATYRSGTNSSLTLSLDDGPGLLVSNFTVNGVDVISGYAAYAGADPASTTVRLYPTDLQSGNQSAWRAVYDTSSSAEDAAFDAEVLFPQGSCQSWSEIDLLSYGLRGLDDFVFTIDQKSGKSVTVEPMAWRVVMRRE